MHCALHYICGHGGMGFYVTLEALTEGKKKEYRCNYGFREFGRVLEKEAKWPSSGRWSEL